MRIKIWRVIALCMLSTCISSAASSNLAPPSITSPTVVNAGEEVFHYTTNASISVTGAKASGTLVCIGDDTNGISQSVAGQTWTQAVSLVEASRVTLVYSCCSEDLSSTSSRQTTLHIITTGVELPEVIPDFAYASVANSTNSITLSGSNNVHVVGEMCISNETTGAALFFSAPLPPLTCWTSPPIAVVPAENTLVVSGSNLVGDVTNAFVVVVREYGDEAPVIRFESDRSDVEFATTNVVLSGTKNEHVMGHLCISNATSGDAATFPVVYAPPESWTAPPLSLLIGSNVVTIVASNAFGGVATAATTVVRARTPQTIEMNYTMRQRLTNIVQLSATASSGLPVTFSIASGFGKITNGVELSFTRCGTVFVRASQAGNSIWAEQISLFPFRVGYPVLWNDYDGDGASDLAVFDSGSGNWYIRTLAGEVLAWDRNWGYVGAHPMAGDHDGNDRGELTVYDKRQGAWHICSLEEDVLALEDCWGYAGAYPVCGDYSGDGACDLALYNDKTGLWHIRSLDGVLLASGSHWGYPEGDAIPGDYDGDGICDQALYNEKTGLWHIRSLSGVLLAWNVNWGYPSARAVPGDYDGDGISDLAVYDRTSGNWYIRTMGDDVLAWAENWGFPSAAAVPGDYDGDGSSDLAVYDETTGNWYIRSLSGEVIAWGVNWGGFFLRPILPVGK